MKNLLSPPSFRSALQVCSILNCGVPGRLPAAWKDMIDSRGLTRRIIVAPAMPPLIAPVNPAPSDRPIAADREAAPDISLVMVRAGLRAVPYLAALAHAWIVCNHTPPRAVVRCSAVL